MMPKPEFDVWYALFTNDNVEITNCKLYKRRWVVLFLFVLYAACGTFHWCQYSTIPDATMKFYHVSRNEVDRTETGFLVIFLLLSWLGWDLLEKSSFRWTLISGMVGTCTAAWIKVLAASPDRFWLIPLAQVVAGVSQMVMVPAIPKISAAWFGANEVSGACGIGIFGVLFGTALGFVLPKYFISGSQPVEVIKMNLQAMNLAVAVVASVVLIFMLRYFEEKPAVAPSTAQMRLFYGDKYEGNAKTVKKILSNRWYCIWLLVYSMNAASMCTLLRLLSKIILNRYPHAHYHLPYLYLIVIFSGMIGCIACGVILDQCKHFKATALSIYMMSFGCMACLTIALMEDLVIVYVVAAVLAFSMGGMLTIGFEIAAELTYPEPLSISCGLLVTISQALGLLFTYAYTYVMYNIGDTFANSTLCGLLLIGCLLIIYIPPEHRRQAAPVKVIGI